MRTVLLAGVVVGLAAPLPSARAAEEPTPRALIVKAIEACGIKASEQPMGLRARWKMAKGAKDNENLAMEMMGHSTGLPTRVDVFDGKAGERAMTLVIKEGGGWMREGQAGGTVQELPAEVLQLFTGAQHMERVTWLLPVLQDKKFTLTALGESKFEDRPVLGVKVVYPDRQDVSLYFDKGTGLLTKAEGKWEKEMSIVRIFRDYRNVDWSAADEKLLQKDKIGTDGPALLKFVRAQVPNPAKLAEVPKRIRQLGDESFAVREEASKALRDIGRPALGALRQAVRGGADAETIRRAQGLIEQLGGEGADPRCLAAVRLLARRKPTDAADVLLAYLPHATDKSEELEVQAALAEVAFRDGKADPSLLKALQGPEPAKHLAAAALHRDGGAYDRLPGRRLYLPGLKIAHKMEWQLKERVKDALSLELVEVQFFNRLDDRLFAKP